MYMQEDVYYIARHKMYVSTQTCMYMYTCIYGGLLSSCSRRPFSNAVGGALGSILPSPLPPPPNFR